MIVISFFHGKTLCQIAPERGDQGVRRYVNWSRRRDGS
jgi:hypothetical protein